MSAVMSHQVLTILMYLKKAWFKMALPAQPSYSLKHLHIIRTGATVPAAHNALPDCYGVLKVLKTLSSLDFEACYKLSEPWEAVEARCFGKK